MTEEQTVASKDRDIWQKGQPSWLSITEFLAENES